MPSGYNVNISSVLEANCMQIQLSETYYHTRYEDYLPHTYHFSLLSRRRKYITVSHDRSEVKFCKNFVPRVKKKKKNYAADFCENKSANE